MTSQSLRAELRSIVTHNGLSARIPEMLELELDKLEALLTQQLANHYVCPWCSVPAESNNQLITHIDMRHRDSSYAPANYIRREAILAALPEKRDNRSVINGKVIGHMQPSDFYFNKAIDQVTKAIQEIGREV